MKRYIEGKSRAQMVLMPESLDDFIDDDNPVRVIDLFVDELDCKAWVRVCAAGGYGDGRATTRACCSSSTSTAI